MVYRQFNRDLKIAVVNLKEHSVLTNEEIQAVTGVSRATLYRIMKYWRETGDVVPPKTNQPRGRPRMLIHDDLDYILRLIEFRPDWFLDELLNLLKHNRFISLHYTTIFRALERCNVSRKKLKAIALERNEALRNDYIRQMAQYTADQLGFLDETSKNDKTPARIYGRSKKGTRSKKRLRLTVVEGSMKRDSFLDFLEYQVVSESGSLIFGAYYRSGHGQCQDSSWR
ncbi:hypothetical protein C8J56DRAFT_1000119 [Mycena floridula]|nr:hypothetical protein C8J56DRAFT_1000119 [Mycena floridula]